MRIKVVSWNIWQSKHIDQVTSQLKLLNPDIAGLQEVTEAQGVHAGQVIAQGLEYHHFFCQSADARSRVPPIILGNSLISRHQITASSCHFLSTPEEYMHTTESEPRVAQVVTLTCDGKELTVINTHLGFSPDLKVTPMQQKQLEKLLLLCTSKPLVLLGDFNSAPDSEIVKTLESHLKNTDDAKTSPTRFTKKTEGMQKDRIDYIFVSPDVTYSNFTVYETQASDHTPISVEIEL